MEPKFQSSFIPKGPLASTGSVSAASKVKAKNLLGFLCFIFFILVVVGAVGIFGYNWYLGSEITKMSNDLQDARAALEPETIENFSKLNTRLVSTKELLDQHVVVSPFFDYLENATLKSVRFTEFDFGATEKGLLVSMKGQARGYASVALQADIFSKSQYLKKQLFSDLKLDDKGNVVFSFVAEIDPALISYKRYIDSLETEPIPTEVQATILATSTPAVVSASSTPPAKAATTTPKTAATSTKPQ
jgi:hypothetical protein